MSKTVNLILPPPPALNHLHFTRVVVPKGRKPFVQRGLTSEGLAYKEKVANIADGMTPFVGDVEVRMRWFRSRRIGDLDGIFKIILDSLTGFAYADDKQVKRIDAERFDDAKRPRVEVEIMALELC